jgi:uncharacterized Rmd1/YagE family protein
MKQTTIFNCFKIAAAANLQPVADFFRVSAYRSGQNYLLLLPDHLETVLKYHLAAKYVWLFKSGSICLVNFDTTETYRLVKHLEAIGLKPDWESFTDFNELHTMESEAAVPLPVLRSRMQITAIVLAKSTELKKLEITTGTTFDLAERFILELQSGLSNPNRPGFFKTNQIMIKLQITLIHNLKILDRPPECYHDTTLHRLYDSMSAAYELPRRYQALRQKLNSLNEVLTPYQKLGFTHKEQRLAVMETILLVLFPLSRLFDYLVAILQK